MKVSKLIKVLQDLESEHGDLQVRLQCDHGQELMRATGYGISYIEEDDYLPEFCDEEYQEDGWFDNPIKVIEVQAF